MKFTLELRPGDDDGTLSGHIEVNIEAGTRRAMFTNTSPENVMQTLGILGDELKEKLTPAERGIVFALGDDD